MEYTINHRLSEDALYIHKNACTCSGDPCGTGVLYFCWCHGGLGVLIQKVKNLRLVFEGIEKRQVFQGIAALLRCCQILSKHTYISNGKTNLNFPYFPWFVRCKRGVNCVRDGQKCLILQGKSAFVRGLPRHTKRILVKCDQPPEKPYSVPFCGNLPGRKVVNNL